MQFRSESWSLPSLCRLNSEYSRRISQSVSLCSLVERYKNTQKLAVEWRLKQRAKILRRQSIKTGGFNTWFRLPLQAPHCIKKATETKTESLSLKTRWFQWHRIEPTWTLVRLLERWFPWRLLSHQISDSFQRSLVLFLCFELCEWLSSFAVFVRCQKQRYHVNFCVCRVCGRRARDDASRWRPPAALSAATNSRRRSTRSSSSARWVSAADPRINHSVEICADVLVSSLETGDARTSSQHPSTKRLLAETKPDIARLLWETLGPHK